MIKVGDYLKFKTIVNGMVVEHIDRIEHVEETPNGKVMIYFENMEHGILFNSIYDSNLVDFKELYEQQKLHADRAEKRWSELETKLKEKYVYLKLRSDNKAMGPIKQSKWNVGKSEILMALKLMHDLEEVDG